ncbi:hypothetical protein [Rhodococcus sp. W8901]|uniref:hypothetical protein n=1 Tax=Rhodococcus sp. W8901 TaxID=2742603 RepID=UPI0015821DC9|nr:hypothetical protein [Rhodococcus sp. W8901]QKT09466.1 hypothetical protein HUN07_00800 [Rhodococcus sp. W8901]
MNGIPSWPEIGAMIDTGHLTLEPGVAEKCAQRCSELIDQLRELKVQSGELTRIDGLGSLPSGLALTRKFEQKASGGEHSLDHALDDHITVVEQMRSVFEKVAADYDAAEQSNIQALNMIDSGR